MLVHQESVSADQANSSRSQVHAAEAWRLLSRAFVHEVRSPLNALSINLDLAANRAGSCAEADVERMRKALDRASAQVARIDRLLGVFLEVWAPDPGGVCDASALLEAVGRLAAHRALSVGSQLQVEGTKDAKVALPGRVVADALGLLLCEAIVPEAAVRAVLAQDGGLRIKVDVDAKNAPSFPESTRAFTTLGARVTDRAGSFEAVLPVEA